MNKVKIKGRAEVGLILLFLSDMHSFIHKEGGRTKMKSEVSLKSVQRIDNAGKREQYVTVGKEGGRMERGVRIP